VPTRLRSLLPTIAFAAIVLGFATPAALTDTASTRPFEQAATAVVVPEPRPHHLALRRLIPKPSLGHRAARIALGAVGVPYRWGGASPESGFDCSGLVYWTYGRLGVELAHSSYALYDLGRRVPRSRLEPGDLLFFAGLGHVGVYVGRGRMVHAPQSGRRVEVVSLRHTYYGRRFVGARRMIRT
jgi:cell wall-associated NlpC family hydrolase